MIIRAVQIFNFLEKGDSHFFKEFYHEQTRTNTNKLSEYEFVAFVWFVVINLPP